MEIPMGSITPEREAQIRNWIPRAQWFFYSTCFISLALFAYLVQTKKNLDALDNGGDINGIVWIIQPVINIPIGWFTVIAAAISFGIVALTAFLINRQITKFEKELDEQPS